MIEAGRIAGGEARASGEWLCWGTQSSRDTRGVQDSPGLVMRVQPGFTLDLGEDNGSRAGPVVVHTFH